MALHKLLVHTVSEVFGGYSREKSSFLNSCTKERWQTSQEGTLVGQAVLCTVGEMKQGEAQSEELGLLESMSGKTVQKMLSRRACAKALGQE